MMTEQTTNSRKRVGIVSVDPLRVVGLKSILEESTNFEGIPLTGPSALKMKGLGIVLIDEGATEYLFELMEEFRRERPKLRLVVMGPRPSQEHIEQVIAAGARGYLSYSASEDEVRLALESVNEGSVWASRQVLARLLDRPTSTLQRFAHHEAPKFTPREVEVLRLLVMGYPNRNIGQALEVDEGTIKAHVGRLMRKMGRSESNGINDDYARTAVMLKDQQKAGSPVIRKLIVALQKSIDLCTLAAVVGVMQGNSKQHRPGRVGLRPCTAKLRRHDIAVPIFCDVGVRRHVSVSSSTRGATR